MIDGLNGARCFGTCVTLLTAIAALPLGAQSPRTTPESSLNETSIVSTVKRQQTTIKQNGESVSLTLRDSSISYVVQALAKQVGYQVVYDMDNPLMKKRVSVHVVKMQVMTALAQVLKGTGLIATLASSGEVIVIRSASDSSQAQPTSTQKGQIMGQVRDSASGKGIDGAVVTVRGSTLAVTTANGGKFMIQNVPTGEQQVNVKIFGYRSVTKAISVTPGTASTLHIAMLPLPTQLSGVVTTATGEQRKVEVGNDITTVRVDSIIRTMPVQNMSDLLATRVPGLYAASTSGNPGAPTKIRIRGVSSVSESNDPIIIVDGIRVASDQLRGSDNMATNKQNSSMRGASFLVSSPLDMIDVNSAETVEVLKGPSAVALYGSDAANGVIVIKTKRGQAGATRVGMSAQFGTETIPGKWPVNYYMWGHSAIDPFTAVGCKLEAQVQGTCAADSLITYQILNDPRRSVLGRGTTQTYRGEVSGGNRGMTYSLIGSIASVIGVVKLPDIDRNLLVQAGQRVPSWLRRPESDMKKSGALNLSMDVGSHSVVTFGARLMNSATDGSPLRNGLAWTRAAPPPIDSVSSGLLAGIPEYRTRISSQSLKSTNSLDITSKFGSRLNTQLTGGTDVTNRTDLAILGTGECFIVATQCPNDGVYNTGQGSLSVTTVNARVTSPLQLGNLLSLRSSIGITYARSTSRDLIVKAEGLPAGATSSNGAVRSTQQQNHADRITTGTLVETVVGIANRWYFPFSARRDAGSALGSMAPFPRLAVSYVLSDDQWFASLPGAGFVSMLQLRAAYGQAGVQPLVSKKDRNYKQTSVAVDGTPTPYVSIGNIGNTQLRPERSKEYEVGFNLDVLNDRVGTIVTLYRKNTVDLLTEMSIPPSVSGGGSQQVNVGDVINTGVEISLNVVPVEHRLVRLANSIQFSLNRNRLTKLGSAHRGSEDVAAGQAIGYPLNGYWTKPVVGVFDMNNDGLVSSTEYILGDSAMYLGAPYPRYSINSNHTMTILNRLSVATVIQYENGVTQKRSERESTIRSYFDPQTPLELQAITQYSDLNKIQTVSVLRFDALSIGYDMPKSLTKRFLRNRMMRVAVQARNVGLWTNYRGLDPKVSSTMGEANNDDGVVPQPKLWQLSIGIN